MPDYLSDLREVVKRGEGSSLRRDQVLRKVRRFEIDAKRAGVDLNSIPQAEFVKNLQGDPREWMFRLCATRLLRGDYSDWTGWEYRNQWAIDSYKAELPNKRWRYEKCRTLALLGEQGIGDEIMFASCVPDILEMGIRPTIECEPRLVPIFRRAFGCEVVPRKPLTVKRQEEFFLPIGDLPRLLRKKKADFPPRRFLSVDPKKLEKWSGLRGRVGLAWRGRRGGFDPKELMKAAGVAHPVSLQYDAWPYELEGMEVLPIDTKNDLEDMLAICANLERVVTVPQTVVHFAGPQVVPVDVVIPPVKTGRVMDQLNYRYGLGPRMDWYPSVNVFQSLVEYRSH